MWVCGFMPLCAWGGQKTTSWDWFSPSTFTWIPGIDRVVGLARSLLYPLSYLLALSVLVWLVGFCFVANGYKLELTKERDWGGTSRLPTGSFCHPQCLIILKSEMCKDNRHSRMPECLARVSMSGFLQGFHYIQV